MQVWKYVLEAKDVQDIEIPVGGKVLHIGTQHGEVCVWALVNPDPSAMKRKVRFRCLATGESFPDVYETDSFGAFYRYLGTVQMAGGNIVFHYFSKQLGVDA